MWGYGTSYVLGAGISAFGVPFLALSRREHTSADVMVGAPEPEAGEAVEPIAALHSATAEPHPCAPTTVVPVEP